MLTVCMTLLEKLRTFDEERQVTKPTYPLQSCRSRTGFRLSRSRSRAVDRDCKKKDNPLINRTTYFIKNNTSGESRIPIRARQLCTGTSALSPGVPRQIFQATLYLPVIFRQTSKVWNSKNLSYAKAL